jgi:hypothetical protein
LNSPSLASDQGRAPWTHLFYVLFFLSSVSHSPNSQKEKNQKKKEFEDVGQFNQ